MKICLDYGHTLRGSDTGAVGNGYKEQDLTREVGKKVRDLLKKAGHTVLETNVDNCTSVSESLNRRYSVSNNNNCDLCVSIHFNAGGGTGSEIFTYNSKDIYGASSILNNLSKLGFRNRGIKSGNNLAMVSRPAAKAMLIEVCFIDTAKDVQLYQSNKDKIAKIIAEGINGKAIGGSQSVQESVSNEKGYVVTNYLKPAYNGYDGVMVNDYMKYFEGYNWYFRSNSKGMWIETQCMSISECNKIKNKLGDIFYSIEK